jgi:hypothetical protein
MGSGLQRVVPSIRSTKGGTAPLEANTITGTQRFWRIGNAHSDPSKGERRGFSKVVPYEEATWNQDRSK